MTTKGKVYSFYSSIIAICVLAMIVFDLNLFAKGFLSLMILGCLCVMRSVQKALLLPPDIDPDTMEPVKPIIEKTPVDDSSDNLHNDSVDLYLKLLIEVDEELSRDPSIDQNSPSYNNLLNERIAERLPANY